ncbi:MAG: hypothetical protein ACJ79A_06415 [Gemmatimonadaceae bacterium]
MRLRTLTSAALALLTASSVRAQKAGAPDLTPYLIADHAEEIALARSAAPRNVSDSATIMVLGKNGYVQAARGTNGFTCLVQRSFDSATNDPNFWNPKGRAPVCFNPPAVRTVLAPMLKRSDWVVAGMALADVEARTRQGYASHTFPAPAPGAMAYMLSARQHLSDADPHWMPHLMFFYDKAMSGASFGAAGMTAPIIDASGGDPHAPVQTIFVPVRQWSDGSAAVATASH